jgi:hypothetical protein
MFLSISAYDFELALLPSTHGPDGVICLLVAAVVVAVAVVFVNLCLRGSVVIIAKSRVVKTKIL